MKTLQLLRQCLVLATIVFGCTVAHSQDGISKTAIVIGQSVALTGPSAALGAPFAQGAKLFFDRLNAGGGVILGSRVGV